MTNQNHFNHLKFRPLDLSRFSKSLSFSADKLGSENDLSFLQFHDWWTGAAVSHRIVKNRNNYEVSVILISTKVKFQIEIRKCEVFNDELKAKVYGLYFERMASQEVNGIDEIKDEFFPISLN